MLECCGHDALVQARPAMRQGCDVLQSVDKQWSRTTSVRPRLRRKSMVRPPVHRAQEPTDETTAARRSLPRDLGVPALCCRRVPAEVHGGHRMMASDVSQRAGLAAVAWPQ